MASDYCPRPLHTEHVTLEGELLDLVELLAENVHDIWPTSESAMAGPSDQRDVTNRAAIPAWFRTRNFQTPRRFMTGTL